MQYDLFLKKNTPLMLRPSQAILKLSHCWDNKESDIRTQFDQSNTGPFKGFFAKHFKSADHIKLNPTIYATLMTNAGTSGFWRIFSEKIGILGPDF